MILAAELSITLRVKKIRLTILFAAVLLAPICARAEDEEVPQVHGTYEGEVTRIIDGNVIEINGDRFQLLGIDAPKPTLCPKYVTCRAQEAKEFLEEKIKGRTITYDYDRMLGRRDIRGVRRIYIYLDGELINSTMIELGNAFTDRSRDFTKKDTFLLVEDLARRRGMGLWHQCPIECTGNRACRTKNW